MEGGGEWILTMRKTSEEREACCSGSLAIAMFQSCSELRFGESVNRRRLGCYAAQYEHVAIFKYTE